ncbi:MAG: hypothetical protein R2711_13975 [Acidimicrobiales bacterium]
MLVTVGTDHHRFDRLIGWVDRWPPTTRRCTCWCSTGPRTRRPTARRWSCSATTSWWRRWREPTPSWPRAARPRSWTPARWATGRSSCPDAATSTRWSTTTRWPSPTGWPPRTSCGWPAARTSCALLGAALAEPDRVRIPPERGAAAETIAAYREVVDPLAEARVGRRAWRHRVPAGPGRPPAGR